MPQMLVISAGRRLVFPGHPFHLARLRREPSGIAARGVARTLIGCPSATRVGQFVFYRLRKRMRPKSGRALIDVASWEARGPKRPVTLVTIGQPADLWEACGPPREPRAGFVVGLKAMGDDDLKWYAIYTKSRHEKVVAEELWQKQIESFLPLKEVISKWKDRKKRVQLPLFPGYLFVHVPIREKRLDIVKVPSVVRVIGLHGVPEPIPDDQIQAVKSLVFSQLPYDPYPYLAQGDKVEIVRGPLRGLRGVLVEKKSKYKFVLSVDLIQQSVACEVDASDVEKI
jgi:transcription termination/antitermination protein NusG